MAAGRVLLVFVDGLPHSESYAWVRAEERWADAFVVRRWRRACDTPRASWIPCDLVLGAGDELRFGTDGAGATADAAGDAIGVDDFAALGLGLDDVRGLADRIGPIEVHLAAPCCDRRTALPAGPARLVPDPVARRAVGGAGCANGRVES